MKSRILILHTYMYIHVYMYSFMSMHGKQGLDSNTDWPVASRPVLLNTSRMCEMSDCVIPNTLPLLTTAN